jgi:uncharacterized protein DUF2865
VDLKGEAYAKLPNAFRFQASYVADCTCRGNPWDQESIARHQTYPPAQVPAAGAVASAEQSRPAEPRRRNRQESWGYRARQTRQDEDKD